MAGGEEAWVLRRCARGTLLMVLSLLCVLCCGDSGTSGVKPGAGHDTAGPRNAALLTEVGYKEHLFVSLWEVSVALVTAQKQRRSVDLMVR